jgi:hypothetical protein
MHASLQQPLAHLLWLISSFMGLDMTDEEIRHYYDTHLNMTLKELSQMTGKTIKELKKIILS